MPVTMTRLTRLATLAGSGLGTGGSWCDRAGESWCDLRQLRDGLADSRQLSQVRQTGGRIDEEAL
jgi:hypothetical protein